MNDDTEGTRNDGPRTNYMHYDPESSVKPSVAIVRRIADVSGDDPTSIEPLYYAIDPEQLDRFVTEGPDGGAIEFTFHGYDVRVSRNGEVAFEPSGN